MSKTAAERQRESRQRKRDTVIEENVTDVTIEPRYVTLDVTVYGRQAVRYSNDTFDTRPEPLDPTDAPDPRNRCIYQRLDGTRYLLDATGNTHEHPPGTQPITFVRVEGIRRRQGTEYPVVVYPGV